jgi:acetylornithine deacetylase/succinyl-diaminopimelate desuccinylase-like protein
MSTTKQEENAALALLAELVAARSPNPPGDETRVAAVVERAAADLGLPAPRRHARDASRPNLFIELGQGAPHLLLCCHMDTVPPGDLAAWATDPYRLERVGDRLHGLGTADMKAAIAAILLAAVRLQARPEPAGRLTLVFCADEENGSAYGMQWLAQEGLLRGDAAAMLEPSSLGDSSWQQLFVGQRGHCVSWLEARGEPGHSGAPVPRERRASFAFARALTALIEEDPFAEIRHPVDGTRPTANIATMVEGGMIPFAHPAALRACLEVRTIEGMTEASVLGRMREMVQAAGVGERVSIDPAPPPLNWIAPGDTVRDPRLLGAARQAWRETLGRSPVKAIFPAVTDSTHANAAGMPAFPAFGPGSLAVAHQPDESILAADLPLAIDLFEALARAYWRGPSRGD